MDAVMTFGGLVPVGQVAKTSLLHDSRAPSRMLLQEGGPLLSHSVSFARKRIASRFLCASAAVPQDGISVLRDISGEALRGFPDGQSAGATGSSSSKPRPWRREIRGIQPYRHHGPILCRGASCPPPSAGQDDPLQQEDGRRSFLMHCAQGAVLAEAAWEAMGRGSCLAVAMESGTAAPSPLDGSLARSSNDGRLASAAPLPNAPPLLPPEVETWERFRGDGFALRVPPGYMNILAESEPEDDGRPRSTISDKPKSPFVARFASPDREEVLSVVSRPTNGLRLSFFEVKDVSDLGPIDEAASVFIPPGARLLATRQYVLTPDRVPRTHYLFEFVSQGMHVAMNAVIAKGQVYVLGATTAEERWSSAAGRMRTAAKAFSLVV
eukprot:TRINITY_DN2469_c0_g1_i2.p1 TRINITY_DN2469_c0_g1~~TRINITY_DN2469_c0_g1_i2.p1  ORF type:complete len:381 (-),score=57.30 TRINITY_DN2469_c0_g1_i2:96-1238(-)